jgi:hypothetical protein
MEAASKTDAIKTAFDALGIDAKPADVVSWLADRGFVVDAAHVRTVRSRAKAGLNGHDQIRELTG